MTINELSKFLNISIDEVLEKCKRDKIIIPHDKDYVLNKEFIRKVFFEYSETRNEFNVKNNLELKNDSLKNKPNELKKYNIKLPVNKIRDENNAKESKISVRDKYSSVKKSLLSNLKKDDSIDALGVLIFFDYDKNNYGFISNIRSNLLEQPYKVFIPKGGLFKEINTYFIQRILAGESVIFSLNSNEKGFYATNVASLKKYITLEKVIQFPDLITVEELNYAINNSIGSDSTVLTFEDKKKIFKVLYNKPVNEVWPIITKIDLNSDYIKDFIESSITFLDDKDKVDLLEISFNWILLEDILKKWTTYDKVEILRLIKVIEKNDSVKLNIPISFINILDKLEITFDEIWSVYSVLHIEFLLNKMLHLFSFKSPNFLHFLKILNSRNLISQDFVSRLQNELMIEINYVNFQSLIKIYDNLKEYRIIRNENELLKYVSEKVLQEEDIETLIKKISIKCDLYLFRQIISNNISDLKYHEIIDFVKLCREENKVDLGEIIFEEYCSYLIDNDKFDLFNLLSFINDSSRSFIINFLKKFYRYLSTHNPLEVLELALITKSNRILKLIYGNLLFNKEDEIFQFNIKFKEVEFSDEIKDSNKPLTAFFRFLNSNSDFEFCVNIREFMKVNNGFVQLILFKFLIFQFHQKKISRNNLNEILNAFQWTDISTILLKTFVNESSSKDNFKLEKLNEVFYSHFKILSFQKYSPKLFLENFSIKTILSRCDGRKHYSGSLWQGNGISRWYYNNDLVILKKETMDCYCEGRFWKSESFWNSETNLPLENKFNFFWCKTSYCAKRNDNINVNLHYKNWKLSDISEVLNINLETSVLSMLSGWANRMNQILKHLTCRCCNEVLRPLPFRPYTLGRYAVPLFHCINDKCSNNEIIRFTHCLNSRCESHKLSEPLDSRDCTTCNPDNKNHTGLRCNYCGTGCPSCEGITNRVVMRN